MLKGGVLSLAAIETDPRPIGDPRVDNKPHEITAPTTNPEQKQPVRRKKKLLAIEGGAAKPKRVNKYALRVKETMSKHNIKSLADASKYIKEHKLYTPDTK